MSKKAIVLPLAFMLALVTAFGISAISYADDGISTDQGMSETISGNGSEEDSGNGGDAGPADEEDSGNGGNAGPVDYEEEQGERAGELPELTLDVEDRKHPVLIGSAQELYDLAEAVNNGRFTQTYGTLISNVKITLTSDIDLSGFQSGGGFMPVGVPEHAFSGEFDGGGFTISNLNIDSEDEPFQGLFGVLGKDAYVHDVKLSGAQVKGSVAVGGIAGLVEYGRISNCTVDGSIEASESLVGGIAGCVINGVIENCSTSGAVTADVENAGGIAGMTMLDNCAVLNCSSSALVTVTFSAGGIVGCLLNGDVLGCSFTGELECASDLFGSMVGEISIIEMDGAAVDNMIDRISDNSEVSEDE